MTLCVSDALNLISGKYSTCTGFDFNFHATKDGSFTPPELEAAVCRTQPHEDAFLWLRVARSNFFYVTPS